MSADNGVYILQLKDQIRVVYTQAIDNLWWTPLERGILQDKLVPTTRSLNILEIVDIQEILM